MLLAYSIFCCLMGFKDGCGNMSSPKHWSDSPAAGESKGRSNVQPLQNLPLKKPPQVLTPCKGLLPPGAATESSRESHVARRFPRCETLRTGTGCTAHLLISPAVKVPAKEAGCPLSSRLRPRRTRLTPYTRTLPHTFSTRMSLFRGTPPNARTPRTYTS